MEELQKDHESSSNHKEPSINPVTPGESSMTITVNSGSATYRYYNQIPTNVAPQIADSAFEKPITELCEDILQKNIPKDSETTIERKQINQKPFIKQGTLFKCSSFHSLLTDLYTPIRRYSMTGLKYGILFGILLHIAILGCIVINNNGTLGFFMVALPICIVIIWLNLALKIAIPSLINSLCMFAVPIITMYISFNIFPQLLGGCCSGALLWCMPGMTIGAIVGNVRKSKLPRAFDAQEENGILYILIPLVLSITIWIVFRLIIIHYLPALLSNQTSNS